MSLGLGVGFLAASPITRMATIMSNELILLITAGFIILIARQIAAERAKILRQVRHGIAAEILYREICDSLRKREQELHRRNDEGRVEKFDEALWRIQDEYKMAEAEREDAWDIKQRRLTVARHLGIDDLSLQALDIARLEVLTEWHTAGKPILRDPPIESEECRGEWKIFADGFALDIVSRRRQMRNEIEDLPSRKRRSRLKAAEKKSAAARLACAQPIILPDGTRMELPSWMAP